MRIAQLVVSSASTTRGDIRPPNAVPGALEDLRGCLLYLGITVLNIFFY